MGNLAFIDGQNLYMGTQSDNDPWTIDFVRFRRYLKEKYKVETAYYFIGFMQNEKDDLYTKLQEAGFVVKFRKHLPDMLAQKKGNVDSDIVFCVMEKMYRKEDFEKIILVSGDGDFWFLVDFLIEEKRFEKILFPTQKYASSLYRSLNPRYYSNLSEKNLRKKIQRFRKQ